MGILQQSFTGRFRVDLSLASLFARSLASICLLCDLERLIGLERVDLRHGRGGLNCSGRIANLDTSEWVASQILRSDGSELLHQNR